MKWHHWLVCVLICGLFAAWAIYMGAEAGALQDENASLQADVKQVQELAWALRAQNDSLRVVDRAREGKYDDLYATAYQCVLDLQHCRNGYR